MADVLNPDALHHEVDRLDGWQGTRKDGISTQYTFDDFAGSIAFVHRVAEPADHAGDADRREHQGQHAEAAQQVHREATRRHRGPDHRRHRAHPRHRLVRLDHRHRLGDRLDERLWWRGGLDRAVGAREQPPPAGPAATSPWTTL